VPNTKVKKQKQKKEKQKKKNKKQRKLITNKTKPKQKKHSQIKKSAIMNTTESNHDQNGLEPLHGGNRDDIKSLYGPNRDDIKSYKTMDDLESYKTKKSTLNNSTSEAKKILKEYSIRFVQRYCQLSPLYIRGYRTFAKEIYKIIESVDNSPVPFETLDDRVHFVLYGLKTQTQIVTTDNAQPSLLKYPSLCLGGPTNKKPSFCVPAISCDLLTFMISRGHYCNIPEVSPFSIAHAQNSSPLAHIYVGNKSYLLTFNVAKKIVVVLLVVLCFFLYFWL
jgi:hypothetical protein